MSDKSVVTRVRLYNFERFQRQFRARMVGAALLTLLFLCGMIYAVVRILAEAGL